jgi:hypothetical protein
MINHHTPLVKRMQINNHVYTYTAPGPAHSQWPVSPSSIRKTKQKARPEPKMAAELFIEPSAPGDIIEQTTTDKSK